MGKGTLKCERGGLEVEKGSLKVRVKESFAVRKESL